MSFLENQNLIHRENEKSLRDDYIVLRMTTHNSACALKGLSCFLGKILCYLSSWISNFSAVRAKSFNSIAQLFDSKPTCRTFAARRGVNTYQPRRVPVLRR